MIKNRLTKKLLIYIVLCSSVFTLLATAFQLYMDYRRDIAAVHESIQFIEKSYLKILAICTYNMEEEHLRLQLQGALKLRDIEYIEITEPRTTGEVIIAAQGNPDVKRDIVRDFTLEYTDAPEGTLQSATLRVIVSLEGVYQRLWSKALTVLMSNIGKAVVASFFIFLIIQFLITRHITKMAQHTRELDIDKLDRELFLDGRKHESSKPDELDQLATAFNHMRLRMAKDIQERKRAHKVLRENEKKYRSLTETVVDIIYTLDSKGVFTYFNPAFEKVTGYAIEDFIGRSFTELLLPEYVESTVEIFKKGLSGEPTPVYNVEFKHKERGRVPVELHVTSLLGADGKPIGRIGIARDITKRKEVEDLYRTLSEKTWTAVYVVQDGVIQLLNSKVAAYAGYKPEELIGKKSISMIHPEDRETARKHSIEMLKEKRTSPYEFRLITKDGNIRWIIETTTSINYKGRQAVLGNSMDITEKKIAEETLKQNEENYRTIFKNTGTAMMIIDEDKTISLVNSELEQLFGYSREDIEGKKKWTEFVVEEDLKRMEEYHRLRRIDPASAPRNYEFRLVDRYGDIKDIFTTVSVIPKTNTSVSSFIDITENKQAERALKESEEKYRSLTETVVDMIFTLDTEGRFTYLNPEFKRVTGYVAEDFMGRSFTEILPPEYIESTVGIFKRGISGEPTPVYEVELKHKDGKSVPVEVNVTTLKSADGTPTGRIGIARDITERKRSEDKIKNSLKEKEVLLQEIHHRVKNNMQIISSLLNLQSDYVKDKESLEMFNESRNRIFSMASVHEKLYQSKDLAKIDFDGYIKSLSRHLLLTYGIKRRIIKLKTNCYDVFLDINKAVPCGLIINELLSNSLKHAFPGGGEGKISIDFHPNGNNTLTLVVSDNGTGFPKDFDISNVKTLGLHLVRALVTQLKGTLELDKTGGTSFKITFAP